MLSITQATEALASVVHTLTSLSVIVTHLASNDLWGAIYVAAIGSLILVGVTLIAVGCELIRFKARQYTRKRDTDGNRH